MSVEQATTWDEANQRFLMAALAEVRVALSAPDAPPAAPEAADGLPAPALETLCKVFGLSPFERCVLLLCAGLELDGTFASLCAAAQGDAARPYPTFGLALAALAEPHWSALAPSGPLRHWR